MGAELTAICGKAASSYMNAASSRSPHREVDKSAAEELGAVTDQFCWRSAEVCNSSRKSPNIVAQDLWLFLHRRRLIWATSNPRLGTRSEATAGYKLADRRAKLQGETQEKEGKSISEKATPRLHPQMHANALAQLKTPSRWEESPSEVRNYAPTRQHHRVVPSLRSSWFLF